MNQAALRAPQEFSKVVLALASVASDALQNGLGIDRTGYQSALFDVAVECSGTPTGGTVTLQLQDAADDVTFANYGAPVVAPITAANAAGFVASIGGDLSGARQFVRVTVLGAPTGGASPVVTASSSARLMGPDRLPAI